MIQITQLHQEEHEFDVCVVGGGMAGMCAAIAAARNGARVAIVHDRPVFGGNASSEVRMWICGAAGKTNRETGILEEIQLENQYRNTGLNYSIWDSVLWGKIHFQPNLTAFLNCSCNGAEMDGEKIKRIVAWQGNTQTVHSIAAKLFIDCSGDSILSALTPAQFRAGREARHEFDEDIEPLEADEKTMGNTLLIQLRRTEEAQTYVAPRWAYKFTSPDDLPHRMKGVSARNFWWLEVGGLQDTIKDAELIRDELMKITYGVWDYIKNHAPQKMEAANWAVEWIGALPGKRENRRYVGDYTLTQGDIRAAGKFDDIVAYGGWSMDDHHPAGLYYPGGPTIFHAAPSPYGIPYRCLYSANVPNLLFAGRNISVTHAALSSTRVMATCAIIGQAAGTAAAHCIRKDCAPRELSSGPQLRELQNTLMDDDCWLPGLTRAQSDIACEARLCGSGANLETLRDGLDRDRDGEDHAYAGAIGQSVEYRWPAPVAIEGVRLVFDSNLAHEKRMPCSYPQGGNKPQTPASLVKSFRIEAQDEDGTWRVVHQETENYQRLLMIPLSVRAVALRLVPEATWGATQARVFAFEPMSSFAAKIPTIPDGPHFQTVRAAFSVEDLAPPQTSGPEGEPDFAPAA